MPRNHFLTGPLPQLKAVWKSYDIAVQVESGDIDHTPALYVIDQQGQLRKVYLTQMAYSSVTQSAQALASEVASLVAYLASPLAAAINGSAIRCEGGILRTLL